MKKVSKKWIFKRRNLGRLYIFNEALGYGKYIPPEELSNYEVSGWVAVNTKRVNT